jgi:murein L,D-transpeptidase YcbB/YkuD
MLPNKKNNYIPTVKKRLLYWGDMVEKDTILSTLYDAKTLEAVKIFQARHGLKPDGVIGRSTIDALNFTKEMRIQQVIANLERWRWYANDFGNHYLLINIPNYTIVAVKDGDTILSQKVVVGKDTRPTPILESKISNINLNPNWTVPPTILREDIYPEAEKNRGVFRKKGLQIFNNKNQEVSPYSWKKSDANKYKYVQNPGRNNSLGLMKINFPNKYSVYLHDTNHRDYFSLNYRSLSSGCVRLEKPLEMAAHILNDTTKWSLKRIIDTTDINHYNKLRLKKQLEIDKKYAKLIAKDPTLVLEKKVLPKPQLKTIVVKVPNDIFVHQLYWTAWQANGTLQFREDIYCLDADLYSKLRY